MEESFSWIPFYSELSRALLKYKKNRNPLVEFIYSELSKVGGKSLVDYIHMEDGSKVKDIDPFSVYAIFNRSLKKENKIAFLQKFKDRFEIKADLPKDFDGIPTVNSQRAFFFNWAEKNAESIGQFWDLFEGVVLKKDISRIFDKIVNKIISQYSLTMILYWIDPNRFLNLDGRNRSYLSTFGLPDNYPNLNHAEYSEIIETIRRMMNDHTIPCTTFPELSHAAWSLAQTERIWMFKRDDDVFDKQYISMGSSAKGKLDFSSFKSKKALGDAYRQIIGNSDVSIPDMYWKMIKEVKKGDVVVIFDSVKEGRTYNHLLYGWGVITSDVYFDVRDDNPIQRIVEWNTPLPLAPIKETRTNNTRYFHEVTGIEAANIIKLLSINKEGETNMGNKDIDKYIQLLRSNKNLILTGAPGTGKTYLAKLIARRMLQIGDNEDLQKDKRFGFVQFHPSYDYTDFVEGLRPVKDSLGAIGFKRQDGVFKAFCKQAILSESADSDTLDDINDNPTVWKVSLGGTYDNQIRTDCLNNGYIRIGWHEYGDVEDFYDFEDFNHGGKNVLRAFQSGMQIGDLVVSCYSAKEADAIGIIIGDYEYLSEGGEYPRYRKVKWLAKNFRENILEQNNNKPFTLSTIYKANITAEAALKIAQRFSDKNQIITHRKDAAVFVIDEINRGEISKIFGELFFSIDPGYRGVAGRVKTQYHNLIEEGDAFKDGFYVPENVYIIGTMNDIDRSVESMDFAMRRRFAWSKVTAEESMDMLNGIVYEAEAKKKMKNLNAAILKVRGLGEAYQIGAAYFKKITDYKGDFQKLWIFHLEGLLFEYLRGNMNAEEELDKLKKAYDDESLKDGTANSNS